MGLRQRLQIPPRFSRKLDPAGLSAGRARKPHLLQPQGPGTGAEAESLVEGQAAQEA